MAKTLVGATLTRPWLRIGLAVALLVVGLAPIGAPIISDSSWRQPSLRVSESGQAKAEPFVYRALPGDERATPVQRSDDGGLTWHAIASIPQVVDQIEALPGNEQIVFARSRDGIWTSEDAGATWSRTTAPPSRPLSMVVAPGSPAMLFVGTESVGLLRSNDRGASWQPVASTILSGGAAAPVGVTALAGNPDNSQIVYAASGFWLGTSDARFNPLGVFASVDGGTHWFEMASAAVGSAPIEEIRPVAGEPLAVRLTDAGGTRQIVMKLSEALLAGLDDADPSARAATARAVGLIGDKAAVPTLLSHLRDPDVFAGQQIAAAIGRLGDRAAIPALLDALQTGDEAVQARSSYALGLLGAQNATPALAKVLLTGGPMAQREAAEALATLATPEAIRALEAPLADLTMTSARSAAMSGLEQVDGSAVGELTAALRDQNPVLRANAAEMLGWIKPTSAAPDLSLALKDPDASVRAQAAWALGEIGTTEARQALAAAVRSETQPDARGAEQLALAHAQVKALGGRAVEISAGGRLLAALARIPASRWTFLALLTLLAVLILWYGPRQARPRGA